MTSREIYHIDPQIGRGVLVHTLVDGNARTTTAIKLAKNYNIAQYNVVQERVVQSALEVFEDGDKYKFFKFQHYSCPMEKALQMTYTVPDHIILKPLTAEHAAEVCDRLAYASEGVYLYLRQVIEFLPSLGAFNKATGELVAWCVTYMNDTISALHVKEPYRGTGLAKLLCKKVIHDRALQNKTSVCEIDPTNVASKGLFLGLGFQVNHELVWGGKSGMVF